MNILGIDPGSQYFGLALLKKTADRVSFLSSELIELGKGDMVSRMKLLVAQLMVFLKKHPIDVAAIEEGFLGKNVKTVEILARIRGLVIALLILQEIPFFLYSPRSIKLAITGYGNADKVQLRKGLGILLGTQISDLSDDESDALAIAYCHFLKEKS